MVCDWCTGELPPHARRRATPPWHHADRPGITSACAEKRNKQRSKQNLPRNYLRIRGEERMAAGHDIDRAELPPHARRRARSKRSVIPASGITSACAEKSPAPSAGTKISRNYLRMRGEETVGHLNSPVSGELPPHARRRAAGYANYPAGEGITSACAEKRVAPAVMAVKPRNYLRMRGEEASKRARPWSILELPPHARRRAGLLGGGDRYGGNYLRMSGEEPSASQTGLMTLELPPHARRRDLRRGIKAIGKGITSACAEKSGDFSVAYDVAGNYLRMRGEE